MKKNRITAVLETRILTVPNSVLFEVKLSKVGKVYLRSQQYHHQT